MLWWMKICRSWLIISGRGGPGGEICFFECYAMAKSNTQCQLQQPAILKFDGQNNGKYDRPAWTTILHLCWDSIIPFCWTLTSYSLDLILVTTLTMHMRDASHSLQWLEIKGSCPWSIQDPGECGKEQFNILADLLYHGTTFWHSDIAGSILHQMPWFFFDIFFLYILVSVIWM